MGVDDAFAQRIEAQREKIAAASDAAEAVRQRFLAKRREVEEFSAAFVRDMNQRHVTPPARWPLVTGGEARGWIVVVASRSGGHDWSERLDVASHDAETASNALVLREDASWYMGSVGPGLNLLWPAALEVYATGARSPLCWTSRAIGSAWEMRGRTAGPPLVDWDHLNHLSQFATDPTDALAEIAARSRDR